MAEQANNFNPDTIRAERQRQNEILLEKMRAEYPLACARLSDRGVDPNPVITNDYDGNAMTVGGFYMMLRAYSVTEKAGQAPTYRAARCVIQADMPADVRDAMFVALNQQSAEEAGHGDKIFGAAYYELGGIAAEAVAEDALQDSGNFLDPTSDKAANAQKVMDVMAVLGGVETLALENAFPLVLDACSKWNHPLAGQLTEQVNKSVKPEEARHVLAWRYLFHKAVAPRGDGAIQRYFGLTNWGRDRFLAPRMEWSEFQRHMKANCPTVEQLIGRPMPVSI